MITSLLALAFTQTVSTAVDFQKAVTNAKPGDRILLAPGEYSGGMQFKGLQGSKQSPIVISASDPGRPPRFTGGLQFSNVAWLEISHLVISKASYNGLNIDDGGSIDSPSHHVTLKNLEVSDLPKGNHDGIKLSGLDDFMVENCTVTRWGGSGIDMVGCHRGVIKKSTFRSGGDSGVQAKGGSSQITVEQCLFDGFGQRGVNIGGSTGMDFFRPAISRMPKNGKYEAKDITVQGCTFMGNLAPVAFVGVDGAVVRFNTIRDPERWAIRILQETGAAGFVPSRNGVFSDNLIIFTADKWASGGVNIGGGTAPETFKFARNFWYCADAPGRSKPSLPTLEEAGVYGVDPLVGRELSGPARGVGAHAFRPTPIRGG